MSEYDKLAGISDYLKPTLFAKIITMLENRIATNQDDIFAWRLYHELQQNYLSEDIFVHILETLLQQNYSRLQQLIEANKLSINPIKLNVKMEAK